MSDAYVEQVVNEVYRTPLSNNPNLTYGTALSPMEIKMLAVVRDENVRNRELQAGNLTQETYERILEAVPVIEQKINKYNIAPISYTLEEREPDIYNKIIEDQTSGAAEERRLMAGVRGNYPTGYTPFETKPPIGFEKRQTIASYGIDPDNPYEFRDRETEAEFYKGLAYQPRKLSKNNIQYILDKQNIKGDLDYLDPTKPNLGFRFKPEGSDTYQILRNPRITRDDIYQFMRQEGPAIGGDIAGVIATSASGLGSASIPKAFLQILKTTAGSTVGAVGGDLARLVYGNQQGYNDLDIEEMLKEAGIAGLYAAGGTGIVNTAMKVFPAFYRLLSGTQVPSDVAEKIQRVLARQEQTLRNKGASEILYGKDVPTVDAINEQTRKFVEKFNAEYKSYNPTLSGANPLDQEAADLEHIWLKMANDDELKLLYNEMKDGNQQVIRNLMRALGKEFEEGTVPIGREVDAAVREQAQQNIDTFVLEGSEAINRIIKEMNEGIPLPKTTIFDNTVKGETEILPKVSTNLSKIKDNYLLDYQQNFNNLINDPRYAEFTAGAGFTRQTAADFNILKNNTSRLFKRKEALKEIEDTLGLANAEKTLLYRLAGKSPDGKAVFKDPEFTIKELFELQTVLNEVRVNSKIPTSRKFAFEAIENINKQIDKAFNDEVAKRLNIKVKSKYGKKDLDAINAYKQENNFGTDLTIAYKEMNQAYKDVDNQLLNQLIKNEAPEQMIPAILNTTTKGATVNTRVSDFIKVLESGGEDGLFYLQKEMLDHIRNNIIKADNTPLQNNKAVRDFINDHKGTLNAIYKDDFGRVFNKNSLDRIGKEIAEQDKVINTLKNTFGVEVDAVNPVYDIVNNIIRAGVDTRSTGQLANDIDFLLQTVKGNEVLENQISQLTKNIILRDVLDLRRGADGQFILNPDKLNRFLNEGLGPDELAGRLTFEETFGKLLGKDSKDTIQILRLLSGMGQREMGPGITEGLSVALKNVESARALPGFKFIQRMLIPPLTQTGRRVTALDVLMNKRAEAMIGRMVADPKLAKEVIATIEGRKSLQNLANFLSAYNNVYLKDMGNELKYYDEEMKQQKIRPRKVVDEKTQEKINQIIENYGQ